MPKAGISWQILILMQASSASELGAHARFINATHPIPKHKSRGYKGDL